MQERTSNQNVCFGFVIRSGGQHCEYEEVFDLGKADASGMPPSSISEGDQITAAGKTTSSDIFSIIALRIPERAKLFGDDGWAMILGGVGFFIVCVGSICAIIFLDLKSPDLIVQIIWVIICVFGGVVFTRNGMRSHIARRMVEGAAN